MTVRNIDFSLESTAQSAPEPEMTIEQRGQSLFLAEYIPYTLFGKNQEAK
jgi:hypothetical protein